MNCLTTKEIYLYLDDKFPGHRDDVEAHISSCAQCSLAVANRRQVLRASKSLPKETAPAGFARQIINFLFPARARLKDVVLALSAGFLSFVFIIFAYLAFTGKSLAGFFLTLSQTLLEAVQTASLVTVKTFKLFAVGFRVVRQLFTLAFHEISRLASFISTEVQILLVAISILGFLTLFYLLRKFVWAGGKA